MAGDTLCAVRINVFVGPSANFHDAPLLAPSSSCPAHLATIKNPADGEDCVGRGKPKTAQNSAKVRAAPLGCPASNGRFLTLQVGE